MPSIHSTELLLILVIALLVIGPERLPAAIRTASLWLGRFRRSFYKVKSEIERELNADEVRRQLHNESVLADIRDAKSDVQKVAKDVKNATQDAQKSVNEIVNSKDFDPGASPATDEQLRNAEAERKAAVTGAGGPESATDAASPQDEDAATVRETDNSSSVQAADDASPAAAEPHAASNPEPATGATIAAPEGNDGPHHAEPGPTNDDPRPEQRSEAVKPANDIG